MGNSDTEEVERVRDAQRGPGGGPTSASLAGLLARGYLQATVRS